MDLFGSVGGAAMHKPDASETVYISSMALIKMLKHGRAGVPMEVMGLMLGEFVDEVTINVVDVFAMPQSGTGVSVEAVDAVFQTNMLEALKVTGRHETVVGWYHSHPGFGCWLSGVDVNTQQSFEALNPRAVAVVVDPIQSVRGKVVIDAFRTLPPSLSLTGSSERPITSNLGCLNKPTIQALLHGLNRHYYSINIGYKKNDLEQRMLMNLDKRSWVHGLAPKDFAQHSADNLKHMQNLLKLANNYVASVDEEKTLTDKQLKTRHVGKQDPKRHLSDEVDQLLTSNVSQCLASVFNTSVLSQSVSFSPSN